MPMKFFRFLLTVVVSVALSLALVHFTAPPGKETAAKTESSYDRVMQTKTLRCGYGTWQPGVYKDPETGKMSGLFVELIEEMGKLDGLNIEWAAETDWGQIPEAINSAKIDAFCAGMANDAARGKSLAYTNPLSYWTFDVLVRANDQRFPSGTGIKIEDLNKNAYSTAYTEGDVLETIVKNEFPEVKGVALPLLGTPADNIMHLTTEKTDFVIFPKVMFEMYEKNNPGKLRYLSVEPPLRVYGNVIAVGIGDLKLQQVLNAAVNELVNSGTYNQIMKKYDEKFPGAFLRVAPAYQVK
jgi:ABC-type amino acid transport substrate-binding protein